MGRVSNTLCHTTRDQRPAGSPSAPWFSGPHLVRERPGSFLLLSHLYATLPG